MNYCPMCGAMNRVSNELTACYYCGTQFYQVENQQPEVLEYLMDDRTRYWKRESRRIKRILGHEPESHLDLGAGIGDFLSIVSASRRVGVETNEIVFKILERKHLALSTIPDGQRFEVVTAYAVIEHVNNAGQMFSKLCQKVLPGGVLVVMVPTLRTPMGQFKNNVHDSPPMHVVFPSEREMDYKAWAYDLDLIRRTYETGGTLPRYLKPKILAQVVGRIWDSSLLSRFPLADHIYSYWKKRSLPIHAPKFAKTCSG